MVHAWQGLQWAVGQRGHIHGIEHAMLDHGSDREGHEGQGWASLGEDGLSLVQKGGLKKSRNFACSAPSAF